MNLVEIVGLCLCALRVYERGSCREPKESGFFKNAEWSKARERRGFTNRICFVIATNQSRMRLDERLFGWRVVRRTFSTEWWCQPNSQKDTQPNHERKNKNSTNQKKDGHHGAWHDGVNKTRFPILITRTKQDLEARNAFWATQKTWSRDPGTWGTLVSNVSNCD